MSLRQSFHISSGTLPLLRTLPESYGIMRRLAAQGEYSVTARVSPVCLVLLYTRSLATTVFVILARVPSIP